MVQTQISEMLDNALVPQAFKAPLQLLHLRRSAVMVQTQAPKMLQTELMPQGQSRDPTGRLRTSIAAALPAR